MISEEEFNKVYSFIRVIIDDQDFLKCISLKPDIGISITLHNLNHKQYIIELLESDYSKYIKEIILFDCFIPEVLDYDLTSLTLRGSDKDSEWPYSHSNEIFTVINNELNTLKIFNYLPTKEDEIQIGIINLDKMHQLEELRLNHDTLKEEDINVIASLKNLKKVNLFVDESIKEIPKSLLELPKIKYLFILGSKEMVTNFYDQIRNKRLDVSMDINVNRLGKLRINSNVLIYNEKYL